MGTNQKRTEEIRELQRKEYKAAAVYVTFKTKEGQRNVLEGLATSKLDIMLNRKNNVDPSAQFHDKILRIVEACEPNVVVSQYRFLSCVLIHIILGNGMFHTISDK